MREKILLHLQFKGFKVSQVSLWRIATLKYLPAFGFLSSMNFLTFGISCQTSGGKA